MYHSFVFVLPQSIGSMVLAHEALSAVTPDVFLDTMGYAFTFPQARMAGCRVVCYVHYPTISTDMLQKVRQRSSAHNNNERVAKSLTLSTTKLIYYTVIYISIATAETSASRPPVSVVVLVNWEMVVSVAASATIYPCHQRNIFEDWVKGSLKPIEAGGN